MRQYTKQESVEAERWVGGALTTQTTNSKLNSLVYTSEAKAVIPIDKLTLSTGFQWEQQQYQNSSDNTMGYKKVKLNTYSPYAEGEYFITDSLIATLGLRYTQSDKFDGEFIPRAYIVYHLNDTITFKGGVAKGCKTPQIKHLSDFYGSTSTRYSNPNISPETSVNYETGVHFNLQEYGKLGITVFRTDFKDAITSNSYSAGDFVPNGAICGTTNCTYYYNDGKQKAIGLEAEYISEKFHNFSLDVGYTYLDRRYMDDKINPMGGKRIVNLVRHKATAKLNYNKAKFNAYLKATGRYDTLAQTKGGNNRPILGMPEYKDFYIFDLGMNYKIAKNHTLNLAIHNLFDKNYFDPYKYNATNYANRYQDYTDGRSFWISYKLEF